MASIRADEPARRIAVRAAIAAVAAAAAICSGCPSEAAEDDLSTVNAADSAAGSGAGADPAPTFAEVYDILNESCGGGRSGCHITGSSADLALPDPAAAHRALVGVGSNKCAEQELVVPGDSSASVLQQVLDGSSECVKPMPLGRDPLSSDRIETVRAWIDGGAPPPD